MAGALVQASMVGFEPLIKKLSKLLGNEYKLLKGVRTEIKFLHRELSTMDDMLRKLSDTEHDAQISEWETKMRGLSYDIEDCIDVFLHHLDRGDADKGFMRRIADQLVDLKARHKIGKQIESLKARVVEESKRHERYNLGQGNPVSTGRLESSVDARLSALYGEGRGLVGIDRPRDKIMQLLNDNTKNLKVVSIVGFGGLGKTTLAMDVYRKIGGKFQCRASSSMSSTPDVKRLLKDILSQVSPHEHQRSETWEKEQLIRKVKECLQHDRYLIVIDDIWSTKAWHNIEYVFPQNDLGSRIITTTRNEDVAAACCYYRRDHVHKIEHLGNQDSRRLFFRRVFDSEDTCAEHFEKVSEEILKKCGGVPLAIVSIASLLASQEVMLRTNWEMILNSLGSMLEENPALSWMNHVLHLSYKDLPHYLKTCMLYLATFPEDSIIRKDRLLRRWIAEGFVIERPGQDLEEVAEGYFNVLINRSMIQPADFNEGGDLMSCRVHDLMLELIISKSKQQNFITTIDDKRGWPGSLEIRRLSLHFSNAECDFVPRSMDLKQTRSLIFSGPVRGIPCISKFELVRVMDLDANFSRQNSYDLTDICRFFLLRYLRIKGNSFKLPKQIRALKHLKTLELAGYLLDVPSDVFELPSLSHLIVPGNADLPEGISKMRALHTLRGFNVAGCPMESLRGLGELTNLRELELSYQVVVHGGGINPGREAERMDALMASLVKLGSSRKLRSVGFSSWDSSSTPRDILSHWDPAPRHLERLHVSMCPFSVVPAWIAHLDSLTSLRLQVMVLCNDSMDLLGKLPSLVDLQLRVTGDLEESIVIYNEAFPSLKNFAFLNDHPCLNFEQQTMRKLQKLSLELNASSVQRQGFSLPGIDHLSSLRQVSMYFNSDSPSKAMEIVDILSIAISKCAVRPSLEIKRARYALDMYTTALQWVLN